MKVVKTENSITLEFTSEELIILADSLIDPLAHFEIVAREKLANCQQRMLGEWGTKLRTERRVVAIPADDKALIELILAQPDYKNRANRERGRVLPGLCYHPPRVRAS